MSATGRNRIRHTGRQRNEAVRLAILEATLQLLREDGYAATTLEAIARRAGIGKQTIYRWWRSKGAVILEALEDAAASQVELPDTGSLEEDLCVFLTRTFRIVAGRQRLGNALRALMAEAQSDPAVAEQTRRVLIGERRAAVRTLLQRAVERSELAADANLELWIDVLYGVFWYRLLVGHARLDKRLATELAHLVAGASAV